MISSLFIMNGFGAEINDKSVAIYDNFYFPPGIWATVSKPDTGQGLFYHLNSMVIYPIIIPLNLLKLLYN